MTNIEYPEVTNKDRLGSKGMLIVQDIVEDSLGWVFRSQITRDFGIDAHIEIITEKSEATGKIIAAQIKCGESFFGESNEDGYVFRPKTKHIRYWLDHSLPVIVVICHPGTRECRWVEVTSENIVSTGIGWKIILPFGQRFDVTHKHVLSQIAGRTLAERIRQRYKNRLQLAPIIDDRIFIEVIHRGGILMGFRRITQSDYRALALSQDYMLYQSDSFYDLETWKDILELSGVEDWEIEEALGKAEQEIA
ncbi:MAG: DUF4365 domain-containing protein [Caldilinea sp.]|nr:DUF4365 domain-containing protein [Caldilineaceae bacterium]MCB9121530.1 DUF4365 domain-containing protein [Caldilineaceae bacterium]MCB9123176.1 DUF4365 domain-containing protein [Caldilineaceae bacterium]MCO5212987.1 DUF4365 domain-containing protein [Caldilinea sp.]MCW5841898.1 DUF4365 domain-containing protein [Caldilinea sp.]